MSIARIVEIFEDYAVIYKTVSGETEDAYKILEGTNTPRGARKYVTYIIANGGEASATYKIQGSVDGTTWTDVKDEAALAAEASVTWSASEANVLANAFFRVMAKSTVSETPTELNTTVYARG